MFGFLKRRTDAPAESRRLPPVVLPTEVVALLRRRDEFNDAALGIHLLDEAQARARWHTGSVWGRLGLVTLGDANDSNPHVLITRGVCRGMVAHFFHDLEPRIEFDTLRDFQTHLLDLRRRRQPLGEAECAPAVHPDQAALAGALLELACADDDADAAWLICLYVPLLRGDPRGVLSALAVHRSFFVREAAAAALERTEAACTAELLAQLAADAHPQVASQTRRSLAARAAANAG